jgi:hypothetical protein
VVCRLRRKAWGALLCVNISLGATACSDLFGPRPRPDGLRPDSTSTADSVDVIWYDIQPRVINQGANPTDSVRITVALTGVPTQLQLTTWSGFLPLVRQTDGTYSVTVHVDDFLFNYRTGDFRNTAAWVEVNAGGFGQQTNLTANVKDITIPLANVQTLAADVQAASHVVNIRFDSLYLGGQVPPQVLRTFYQFFPDDYDFVSVLEQVHTANGFFYFAVRNTTSGLGLQTFERTETYGTTGTLHGVLHFPDDTRFDPAETSVLHELSHRWMNFSNLPSLRTARPHWPISTLARGINGFPIADSASADGTIFRFELTPQPDGSFSVRGLTDRPRTYNDFELYLLGLLPPDSVRPHVVFLNQDQRNQLRTGGTLSGPTDTVNAAEWIARDGVREPAYPQAQRNFRMATIVLSRARLLTRDELSFYNAMAMRAESEVGLLGIISTTRFTTLPFFPATGGRGRLVTTLRVGTP